MGDLLADGRQSDANGSANSVDGWPWGSAQQGSAPVPLDFDLVQIGQIVEDRLPFNSFTVADGKPVHQFLAQHNLKRVDLEAGA